MRMIHSKPLMLPGCHWHTPRRGRAPSGRQCGALRICRVNQTRIRALPDQEKTQGLRDVLLKYVKEVEPGIMEEFIEAAPSQIVEAMRSTITNMLGSLPPHFFDVKVKTMGENLSQLMFSVMMTGYMFRNAEYRLELSRSLGVLPAPDDEIGERAYATGAQAKDVQGEVLRWHHDNGVESISALQYIHQLETENAALKHRLEQERTLVGRNDILDYIRMLDAKTLKELTAFAEEDVLLAMDVFIQRMMGTNDSSELRQTNCESSCIELARLLYWLMVVGYTLRSMEVRFDMEKTFTLAELPAS